MNAGDFFTSRDAQFATRRCRCQKTCTNLAYFHGEDDWHGDCIERDASIPWSREIASMLNAETTFPTLTIPSSPAIPNASGAATSAQPIIYSSAELLQGRREVWIEHGDQMYRLRVTSAKKLYLTK